MEYSYDLNGVLILRADAQDKEKLREIKADYDGFPIAAECEALEELIANSELEWMDPSEIGALTDAPILGIRDYDRVSAETDCILGAWGFMDYQVRSFCEDLLEKGEAVFIS